MCDAYNCKTIEDAQRYIEFGRGCGMCLPYVERMLETGQIEFDNLIQGVKH
jgi:NAD(P)H-nitrite reductase large subunit